MAPKRGMGRGLAAILPETPNGGQPRFREVPTELIRPNPDQPRKHFDEGALAELAGSIERAGILQPLVVRPLPGGDYELIAGERRLRAARQAGVAEVPVILREGDESGRLELALIENVAREDLNPVDEARALATLVDDLGVSKEEVASRVGRSRPAVSNLIRLLELPDETLAALEHGELSEGHGRAILAARDNDVRRRLTREAIAGGWSVRETERRARDAAEQPRPRPRAVPTADQTAALEHAADALESAFGREVTVRATKSGLRAEVEFDDLDELLVWARARSTMRAA